MVRSKERREAYIHEVGHVDTNHVELEPPGGFPTTIYVMYLLGILIKDIKKILEPKVLIDPATKVLFYYYRNLQVFD
jgi:hypothetical protein